ncbi:Integrin beta-1, partial [Ophiophagus hannah]
MGRVTGVIVVPCVSFLGSCQPQPSCHECIQSHPSCAWCKQPHWVLSRKSNSPLLVCCGNSEWWDKTRQHCKQQPPRSSQDFVQAGESDAERCAPRPELEYRGCLASEIMDPQGKQRILEDRPLRDNIYHENITQLSPQRIVLQLRPGKEQTFTVRFKRAEGYPVDLYYLMDLSYSMKDDLEKIKQLGSDLMAALRKVTTSVKIALQCVRRLRKTEDLFIVGFGAFVDKTVLPYVNMVPSKRKHPCQIPKENCQPAFSYRHVLALTENASEFESRVGQQRISANLDDAEGGFDALMQAAICKEQIGWRNVTSLLVFTSDGTFHTAGDGKLGGIHIPNDGRCHLDANGVYSKSHLYDYPSLGHLAEVLSKSNIQPIFAVTSSRLSLYKELSKLIPKSVVGELKSDSRNVVQLIEDAYKVQFTVKIMATTCLPESQKLVLRVLGVAEEVQVELSTTCECQCEDTQPDAHHCSGGHGNLTCGICRYLSDLFHCVTGSAGVVIANASPITLAMHVSAAWIPLDAPKRARSAMGMATASATDVSVTLVGWAATVLTTRCPVKCTGEAEGRKPMHRGKGLAVCSWDCAECKAFGTGPLSQNCSNSCSQTVRMLVASVDERWCQMKRRDGRLLIYLIEEDKTGSILLTVNDPKVPDFTSQPNLKPVLMSVVTVVSIGVFLIVLFRGIVEFCDWRKFRHLEKERKSALWSQVSAL